HSVLRTDRLALGGRGQAGGHGGNSGQAGKEATGATDAGVTGGNGGHGGQGGQAGEGLLTVDSAGWKRVWNVGLTELWWSPAGRRWIFPHQP
ncbi:hypothetical protein CWV00_25990, partial [Salmonella enterica]|nr:hypothetical protein [Salmonella enterica]